MNPYPNYIGILSVINKKIHWNWNFKGILKMQQPENTGRSLCGIKNSAFPKKEFLFSWEFLNFSRREQIILELRRLISGDLINGTVQAAEFHELVGWD